jgi:hypothetical protein
MFSINIDSVMLIKSTTGSATCEFCGIIQNGLRKELTIGLSDFVVDCCFCRQVIYERAP